MAVTRSPTMRRDAAFFARAVVFFGLIALVIGGLVYLIFLYDPAVDMHPGNPNSHPMNNRQRAAESQPFIDAERQRRDLADKVIRGDMSFEEAGCIYQKGSWDDETQICTPEIDAGAQETK